MHRFLVCKGAIKNGQVTIDGENARHLLQVLRHRIGDHLLVFDGTGMQYEAELVSTGKHTATGQILKAYDPQTEALNKIILYQGIPKADKMDWIIQKTVELGVFQLVPVMTQYTVKQLHSKGIENRLERWNRIAREACKQSGRTVIPEVLKPVHWNEALEHWVNTTQDTQSACHIPVLCYENESKNCLKDLFICYNIDYAGKIGVFIGPEGGYSNEELQMAKNYGISPVSLGKRILRTETAAVAVVAIIMHILGEMRQ